MGSKSADEILGFEFDWLASDADGQLAVFSTAGGGYAPEVFLRDTGAHDTAIDVILALAACTKARFAPQLRSDLQNTWRLVAERGLYAFDSDPNGGPYRLVAAPEDPGCIARLPDAAAAVARQLVFPHLRFSEVQEISRDTLERSR